MSDGKIEQEQPKSESKQDAKESKETSPKKHLFGNLNTDLRDALSTWENLTEEMANKVSPEEEQLLEVKRLLGELKSKLKEFGD